MLVGVRVHVNMTTEDNLSRTTMERLVGELKKSGTVSTLEDADPLIGTSPRCPFTLK
jgi:hypothetical protein